MSNDEMTVRTVAAASREFQAESADLEALCGQMDRLVETASAAGNSDDARQLSEMWQGSLRGDVVHCVSRLSEIGVTLSVSADQNQPVNDPLMTDQVKNISDQIAELLRRITDAQHNLDTYGVPNSRDEIIDGAIHRAEAIAGDNSGGDTALIRFSPGCDSSLLVAEVYSQMGLRLPENVDTGTMQVAFEKAGFACLPGPVTIDVLEPGDVVLDAGHYAALCVGDGVVMGVTPDSVNGTVSNSASWVSRFDLNDVSWSSYGINFDRILRLK